MVGIRHWISLVEGQAPSVFYHGTSPIRAAAILSDNSIDAIEPVDDDGHGAVVCVTSKSEVADAFANEFVRYGTFEEVGVVFAMDAQKIMSDFEAFAYDAETASFDEAEYRVRDSIRPLANYLLGIRIVGDRDILLDGLSDLENHSSSEASAFIKRMWKEHRGETSFASFRAFCDALGKLIEKSS